jgi:hypothetical protein
MNYISNDNLIQYPLDIVERLLLFIFGVQIRRTKLSSEH